MITHVYAAVATAVADAFYALWLVFALAFSPVPPPNLAGAVQQIERPARTEATMPNGVFCPNVLVCPRGDR